MADPKDKVAENVPGTYYVDSACIDCDVCRDTAPDNFTRSDEGNYSFVFKQPQTDDERALCEEALVSCPVEAIGNDG
jgi:ferredoxin